MRRAPADPATLDNPFGPRLSPMSSVRSVTHVSGSDNGTFGAGEGIRTLDPNLGNVPELSTPLYPAALQRIYDTDIEPLFSLRSMPNAADSTPRPDLKCFHSASNPPMIGEWKQISRRALESHGKGQQAHGRRSETFEGWGQGFGELPLGFGAPRLRCSGQPGGSQELHRAIPDPRGPASAHRDRPLRDDDAGTGSGGCLGHSERRR